MSESVDELLSLLMAAQQAMRTCRSAFLAGGLPAPPLSELQALEVSLRRHGLLDAADGVALEIMTLRLATQEGSHVRAVVEAVYLGERRYRVADEPPIILEEAEDHVLRSLIELGGAAKKDELVRQSGKDDAPRVLKTMREKHPALARHITLPGGRGRGGYRTSIRDARPAKK
jgi:hypothetical protein